MDPETNDWTVTYEGLPIELSTEDYVKLSRLAWDDPPAAEAMARALLPKCHCGQPVAYGFDGDPTHHRGMCSRCDSLRCDAYPGTCERQR